MKVPILFTLSLTLVPAGPAAALSRGDAVDARLPAADDRELRRAPPRREVLAIDERGLFADRALELGLRADDLDAHRRAFFDALNAAATMFG